MPQMKLEAAMARLEELTRLLESGSLPLEEAIKAFEEGCAVAALCNTLLNEAQLKVEALTRAGEAEGSDGK